MVVTFDGVPILRLYSLVPRVLRQDGLAAIDAPLKPGLFKTAANWRDVMHALAAHKVAAMDPPDGQLLPVLWGSPPQHG